MTKAYRGSVLEAAATSAEQRVQADLREQRPHAVPVGVPAVDDALVRRLGDPPSLLGPRQVVANLVDQLLGRAEARDALALAVELEHLLGARHQRERAARGHLEGAL